MGAGIDNRGGREVSENWNNLPMVTCPHCDKEDQWDDYYDLRAGDVRDCPNCEKEIHILELDTIITICVGAEGAK